MRLDVDNLHDILSTVVMMDCSSPDQDQDHLISYLSRFTVARANRSKTERFCQVRSQLFRGPDTDSMDGSRTAWTESAVSSSRFGSGEPKLNNRGWTFREAKKRIVSQSMWTVHLLEKRRGRLTYCLACQSAKRPPVKPKEGVVSLARFWGWTLVVVGDK